MVKDISVLQ